MGEWEKLDYGQKMCLSERVSQIPINTGRRHPMQYIDERCFLPLEKLLLEVNISKSHPKNIKTQRRVFVNVLKTGSDIEPEKLLVHGLLVGQVVKPRSNR